MQTLAAGAQAYQLADGVGKVVDALKSNNGQQGAVLLSVEAGFGFKTAGKEQNQNYRQSRQSSLKAGGDINIRSREGDITIGGKKTSARALGIHTDSATAHHGADSVPDLQNLLDKQQTVAQSTAVIHSAVGTYRGNRAKAAAEELEKQQAAHEGRLKEQNDGSYEHYLSLSDAQRQQEMLAHSPAYAQAYQEARSWGIGGSKSRALTAAETLITGALGGQGNLQLAANTLAPYAAAAIGRRFGHGENKNEAAQAIGHFMLGAALAYANGADPLAGGSAAVAAERAAKYLAGQYDDGRTAIDPTTGKFNPNLLPEPIKEEIKAQTGALASVVGAAGGSLNGTSGTNTNSLFNAQAGGVLGQNAVENNLLNNEDRKKYDLLTEKILNHTASNEEKAEFERLAAKDQVSNELYRKYYSDLHRKDGKKDLTTQEAASLRSYLDIIYDDQKILDRKIKNDLYQGKEILRNGEPYYPFWLAKRDRKVREHWNNSWKEIQDARGKYKTGLATVKHFFLSEGRPIGKYEKAWNILERDKAYADSFEGRAAASTAQGMALLLEFTTRGRYLMTALGGVQAGLGINQIKQGDVEHGKVNFFLGAGTVLGNISLGLGPSAVRKSPLAIREPIPARYNRPPTSLDVNAGRMTNTFSTAHPTVTNLNAFKRLNVIDDAVRKFAPAEAATAAQLEKYLGRMERISGVSNGKSADFIIINGANKGKTVDMMYTTKNLTDQQINKMNQFYKKNMESGVEKTNILKHLEKADIVPMDIRFFTFENRLILLNHIKTLPKNLQRKIIIVR
ncbi:TPA: hypothetical protein ACFNM3_002120 [Neisseria lactamica]